MLSARGLVAGYGGRPVLAGLDLDLGPGFTAIIGANAAGKSTLLRCLAGVQAHDGRVHREGRLAYLPQDGAGGGGLTVRETVLVGLLPELGLRVTPAQTARVAVQLAELGIVDLAQRRLRTLSGGQRQLVWLAQALVRDPAVLLLDEPTNHLDLGHQFDLLGTLRRLVSGRGLACAVALHEVGLAARWADRLAVLHHGRLIACGPPAEVLTPALMAEVYGIHADILDIDGSPWLLPRHRLAGAAT
jgi:iron complex transport system ATP-binding protein